MGAGAARLLVGAATLCVLAAGRSRPGWSRHWRTSLFGGAMVAMYQLTFFYATRHAGVAVATVCTIASGPVFAGLIDAARAARDPLRTATITRAWWTGTLASIVGVVLLVSPWSATGIAVGGVVAAVASGLGYALYATAAKTQMENGLDAAGSMAALFSVSAVLTLPLLFVEPMGWLRSVRGGALLVHRGVITVGVAYTLYGRGLRRLPTPTVVTLTLIEPITAAVLSVVVLHESLSAPRSLGIGIVLAGLLVATRRARSPAVRVTR
jgi:DME family drug/metabolite transporter